jgi:alpha-glucosidase
VRRLLAFVVLTVAAFAQDERRVTSPNGQIEFRLFIAVQESNNLPRLAYEVLYRGKPLVKTSFMGLDIEVQEPLLGENVGLTSSGTAKTEKYNSLVAHYMQNGSLGRLIDVEVRAYNDGVAFRYVIPRSTPLMEFAITEEATEFRFAGKVPPAPVPWDEMLLSGFLDLKGGPPWFEAVSQDDRQPAAILDLAPTWIAIAESKQGNYPPMRLIRTDQSTYLTRPFLRKSGFEATTPLTCPWRIISVGPDPKSVIKSVIVADLNRN